MPRLPIPPTNTRLGFHYFPDTFHYRECNLREWLPELEAIGASWLTLIAPSDRAIPEIFLGGLLAQGIEPILHFHLPIEKPTPVSELCTLFEIYSRWGAHYTILFDRINIRNSWPTSSWAQADLVERFLDRYLPYAHAAYQSGLIPVFPPLEPGGDYWDTAFLRAALQGIERRGHKDLLEHLVIGAYARVKDHSINWGSGGPELWPQTRPYFTPPGEEDHRGFRIFDWYASIAQAAMGKPCAFLLFEAGSSVFRNKGLKNQILDLKAHTLINLTIAKLLMDNTSNRSSSPRDPQKNDPLEPVPHHVLASNYWLLAAAPNSPHVDNAWFKPDGTTLPIIKALQRWMADGKTKTGPSNNKPEITSDPATHSIKHYLLLPSYEWGIADWHLDTVRPFVKEHQPTVGFSLKEASSAARVTVVGGVQAFSDSTLAEIRAAGCIVERISAGGTSIATSDSS